MTTALIAAGILTGLTLLLLVVVGLLRWLAARNVEGALGALDDVRHVLPEGHRPPPGLGPISPSERSVTAEVQRGLRDLQLFLLDAA